LLSDADVHQRIGDDTLPLDGQRIEMIINCNLRGEKREQFELFRMAIKSCGAKPTNRMATGNESSVDFYFCVGLELPSNIAENAKKYGKDVVTTKWFTECILQKEVINPRERDDFYFDVSTYIRKDKRKVMRSKRKPCKIKDDEDDGEREVSTARKTWGTKTNDKNSKEDKKRKQSGISQGFRKSNERELQVRNKTKKRQQLRSDEDDDVGKDNPNIRRKTPTNDDNAANHDTGIEIPQFTSSSGNANKILGKRRNINVGSDCGIHGNMLTRTQWKCESQDCDPENTNINHGDNTKSKLKRKKCDSEELEIVDRNRRGKKKKIPCYLR
jgi:hypothetical protein